MANLFNITDVSVLIHWVLVIWFLTYVPRKRSPSSAIAWILIVILLPIVGIALFFLIGSPNLSKKRRLMQKQINSLIDLAIEKMPDETKKLSQIEKNRYLPIIRLGQALGRFPLTSGNTAKIFPEYNDAIKEITKAISSAKEFISFEYFILAIDDTTQPLFDAIEAAVSRGVKIRVLIDGMGYKAYPNRKKMKAELTRMGVEWHMMLPIKLNRNYNRPDLRNHRKVVVIDDEVAYLGSQNIVDRTYHRKDETIYDELVIKLTGPVVRQCSAVFASDWYMETNERLTGLVSPKKRPLPKPTGTVRAQIIPSGPSYDSSGNLELFIQLIHTAQEKVVITNPYFIPSEALLGACKSAAQRGVEVVMINSETMDQPFVGHAQRSFYEELLEAGVKIYLYKSPVFLHSKHLTIDDDIAVVGSSNMDIRSFALDLECVVVLYDKKVVSDLKKVQVKNLHDSKQVTLSTWRKRKLRYKFFEGITRLTSAIQ